MLTFGVKVGLCLLTLDGLWRRELANGKGFKLIRVVRTTCLSPPCCFVNVWLNNSSYHGIGCDVVTATINNRPQKLYVSAFRKYNLQQLQGNWVDFSRLHMKRGRGKCLFIAPGCFCFKNVRSTQIKFVFEQVGNNCVTPSGQEMETGLNVVVYRRQVVVNDSFAPNVIMKKCQSKAFYT